MEWLGTLRNKDQNCTESPDLVPEEDMDRPCIELLRGSRAHTGMCGYMGLTNVLQQDSPLAKQLLAESRRNARPLSVYTVKTWGLLR